MADQLRISSNAFDMGEALPAAHTCEGAGTSPGITWSGVPEGTRSLVLVAEDPDARAKTFVHWVLFNIPPERTVLPADLDTDAHFEEASLTPVEGVNDFGDTGYGAPCPPPGHDPHHYWFRLYALDTVLDLETGATRNQLSDAMAGHVLDEADLMCTCER